MPVIVYDTHRVPTCPGNLENKFIFQRLENQEISWEKILFVKEIHLEQKSLWINIMPVEENFDCRRKRVQVHSLDISCYLKLKWVAQTARRDEEGDCALKMSIINHTLIKYMPFFT